MATDIFVNDRKKKLSRLPLKGTFRDVIRSIRQSRYKRDQLLEQIYHITP